MTKMTSFPDLLAQLRRGKHPDGRQSTSSFCGNIVTAVRVLPQKDEELQRPTEYPMLQDGVLSRATECLLRLRKYSDDRQSTRCYWMEYSHGRQSTCHNCGNTLTADRVLPQFEQTSRRPTEYLVHFVTHDRQNGRRRAVARELLLDGCEWNVENNNHLIYILLWQQT